MVKRKRVNLKIKEDLHLRAKILATMKDMSLNDYIEQALIEAIEKDSHLIEKLKVLLEDNQTILTKKWLRGK